MAELRIALNSTTPTGVGTNEVVLYPTNTNGGELNVVGSDGQPKRLLTDLTTLNNITVSGSLEKTGTTTAPNINLPKATTTSDGAMPKEDKQILEAATDESSNNTLVKRDGNGSFSANNITATLFNGPSTSTQLIPSLTGVITSDGTTNVTTLTTGVINNSHIATGAQIAIAKLATNPLDRANHTGTQLYTSISNFNLGVETYITNNKLTTSEISSNAGILMSQLAVDPTNRANHIGPHPASALEDLADEVNPIINTYLVNNPITNGQITNNTIEITKLAFNPLDRSTHTGFVPSTNISGLENTIRNSLSTSEPLTYDSNTGQFGLTVDTNTLRVTSSGVSISDTYVANIENGGTGASTKGAAVQNLQVLTSISADTSLNATHQHVLASSSATDITITLPAANGDTRKYYIKKTTEVNQVIINPGSGDTIEGESTVYLDGQYDFVVLQNDGNSLWVVWESKNLLVGDPA